MDILAARGGLFSRRWSKGSYASGGGLKNLGVGLVSVFFFFPFPFFLFISLYGSRWAVFTVIPWGIQGAV